MKQCGKCKIEKNDNDFTKLELSKTWSSCRSCVSLYNKEYKAKYKEELKEHSKQYKIDNVDKVSASYKKWADKNKDKRSIYMEEYRQKNKKKLIIQDSQRRSFRKKIDLSFKLRINCSALIRLALQRNGSSKNGKSILKHLLYSVKELEMHVENLFSHPDNLVNGKVWMTNKNCGKYNSKTWDDNDPTTWTWQLDHIIPHSTFEYKSMEDQFFRDCWALENLRPYSAKQNMMDGSTKIRHKRNK
jgi:hypothetical protein